MGDFKIVIFIMTILITLTAIANKRKLPYPIILVFAGLIIGFVPQLPELVLDPDVIFVIILPPLLYDAASKTSWHEFKTSIRPISALAISLVLFTTVTVAITAHYFLPGFSWPLAFVLGAIISPPDAVAATGIIKGLGLNKKVVTIIEGESLVNDASALIAYRYAVIAVSTGTFILWQAALQFLIVASMGIAIGVIIGYLFVLAHKKIENNAVVETSLTLLAPFAAYLAAEHFHMSGVLAVVSAGLVIAWRSHEVFSYQARMRSKVVWDTLIFLLQGFVFILIGLQLPSIIKALDPNSFLKTLAYGLLISFVTILVRIIWVVGASYSFRFFQKKKTETDDLITNNEDDNNWKNVLVVAWTGTRGIISLAAALALPLAFADGTLFPKRHAIILLAFVVIFVTLVVQGLSLPFLIRMLKIKPQANADAEENELQLHLATNTLHYIEHDLQESLTNKQRQELVSKYEEMILLYTRQLRFHKNIKTNDKQIKVAPTDHLLNAKLEISKFERTVLLKLHEEGEFSDAILKKVEREMDIDELKLSLHIPKQEKI